MSVATDLALTVKNAVVTFPVGSGRIHALDDVSLHVGLGEAVAVVGESGCGKTTLARAVLGLQPLDSGAIDVAGRAVRKPEPGLAERVGMVWQDPFASIQPMWRIRRILEEPYRLARKTPQVTELMDMVGLDPKLADRYPHQLSGGQRQRAAIARAISLRPPLVICDEPTAALDLSIQAQILNLLKDLKASTNCSYLYISHDLQTVRYVSDRIVVMYMGQVVETGPTEEVFQNPRHPYTKALLDSAPGIEKIGMLPAEVSGEIPDPKQVIPGCKFASRCTKAQNRCREERPEWTEQGTRGERCFFPLSTIND
ncbi:MAG: ABC transporter ATP-binding protein [Armatimonadetes bacterium]|nr:ABC transporter ATP-binding protein [Armatimonadota bacterium]